MFCILRNIFVFKLYYTKINHHYVCLHRMIVIQSIIMKTLLLLSAFLAISYAMSIPTIRSEILARRLLPALLHNEIHDQFGQFALRYITAEGTVVTEYGRLIPTLDRKSYVLVTNGEISFFGDDGKIHINKFTAGIDGYKPEISEVPIENVN